MSRILTIAGLFLTVAYLAMLIVVFGNRLPDLKTQPLNEVGDFLAGAFGPLAILWLVLGFLQQGIELRINTRALQLQAEELKNSVAQQQALVEVAKQQFNTEWELLQHERARIAQSLLPIIVFEGFGAEHHGTGVSVFQLPVRNVGHTVTNVRFALSGQIKRLEPSGISHWQPDHKIKLVFSFEHGKAEDCSLLVRYTDVYGKDGRQEYALTADLTGQYPKITVNPYPQRETLTPDGV